MIIDDPSPRFSLLKLLLPALLARSAPPVSRQGLTYAPT